MLQLLRKLGISPKVFGPLVVSLAGALSLYLTGQTHLAEGAAMAALVHFVLGYTLPPGVSTLPAPADSELEQPDLTGLNATPAPIQGSNPPTETTLLAGATPAEGTPS